MFYANEHPPAHFHAKIAEFQAVVDIDTVMIVAGRLPPAQTRVGARLGMFEAGSSAGAVCGGNGTRESRTNRMSDLPRIKTAEPIIPGVLKLVFQDGYEGVVDLRPLLSKGGVFTPLQDPAHFARVKVDEFGHSVSWIDDDRYEVDLSADGLRRDCERQAEIHKLMVV